MTMADCLLGMEARSSEGGSVYSKQGRRRRASPLAPCRRHSGAPRRRLRTYLLLFHDKTGAPPRRHREQATTPGGARGSLRPDRGSRLPRLSDISPAGSEHRRGSSSNSLVRRLSKLVRRRSKKRNGRKSRSCRVPAPKHGPSRNPVASLELP